MPKTPPISKASAPKAAKASVLKMDVASTKTTKAKKKKTTGKMKPKPKSSLSTRVVDSIIGGKRFAINNSGLEEKLDEIELLYNLAALTLENA